MFSHLRRHQWVALTVFVFLFGTGAGVWGGEERSEAQSKPAAASQPAVTSQPATASQPATTASAPAQEPPKVKTVPLSFQDAPMDQIARFLTDQLSKPVMVAKEVKDTKITLLNPKPLPLEEAMYVLTIALQESDVAIDERQKTIHLIPISEVIRTGIETIGSDVDVSTIVPRTRIVRKVFEIKHYDPGKLIDALNPLMPKKYGHITAEPTSRKLMVVASVDRLITISRVITELDRPDVSGGELRVFPIKHGVLEIVPTLQRLIASYLGVDVKAITTAIGEPPSPGPRPGGEMRMDRGPEGGPRPAPSEKPAEIALVIKGEKTPVLLIPEPRQSRIVVAAPRNVLNQIEIWLQTLDQPKPPSTQWEIVEIQFNDAEAIAGQLASMLGRIPDESLRNAVQLYPFGASRRIMIAGSPESREIIKTWLKEIDISDAGQRIQKTFVLEYGDAQKVAENIKELFGTTSSSRSGFSFYDYYYSSRSGADSSERNKVTVTANARRNSVTVLASPEKMEAIERQIEELDKPLEGDEAAPLIMTLKYADPEKTKLLLESLFTEKDKPVFDWWGRWTNEGTASPVGRLFGQFRFEAYPETGKLIVVSKSEENYAVIKKMIEQIDSPQEAGVPRTIQLKFADAETLAEQLNALLNAPGTPTSILRRGRLQGFEQFTDERSPYSQGRDSTPMPAPSPQDQQAQSVMSFWWQQPPRPVDVEMRQPSNLVGKLRIVPNIERNLLLVAAPEEYTESIQDLVNQLDQPGYQVLIKAVIAEITLDDSMSLGYRFSSDPAAFTGDPNVTDNALQGLFTYTFEDTHANTSTFTVNADVNNLLSLLGKVTDLKIKSEPKILTADNIESEFFDGQDIPFISSSRLLESGGRDVQFDYFPVGITLRVRPHITEEQTINLTVKLRVSSILSGKTLFDGAIVDRRETTTQITLENGKTFMISGILREAERQVIQRVPGLGDIPILGEVFKHRETTKVNNELLVLLTPYVIGPKGQAGPERTPIQEEPQQRLEQYFPKQPAETQPAFGG